MNAEEYQKQQRHAVAIFSMMTLSLTNGRPKMHPEAVASALYKVLIQTLARTRTADQIVDWLDELADTLDDEIKTKELLGA